MRRRNVQTKKPAKERSKKDYTPFPPPQQPSKVREGTGENIKGVVWVG